MPPPLFIEKRLPGQAWRRSSLPVAGGTSPQSLILVDGGGERTVLCRRDERVTLKPGDLDRQWIVNARALHVDGFDTEAATSGGMGPRCRHTRDCRSG